MNYLSAFLPTSILTFAAGRPDFENRNELPTDAVARLWYEIVTGALLRPIAGGRVVHWSLCAN